MIINISLEKRERFLVASLSQLAFDGAKAPKDYLLHFSYVSSHRVSHKKYYIFILIANLFE